MKKMEDFEAVIFQHYYHSNLSDLPVKRNANQYYVYYNIESPAITDMVLQDFHSLANYFNLSMTYRLNADISHRYGRFVQVDQHPTTSQDLNRRYIQALLSLVEIRQGRVLVVATPALVCHKDRSRHPKNAPCLGHFSPFAVVFML